MATKPDWRPGFRDYVACYALYLLLLALSVLTFYLWYNAAQWLFPVLLGYDLAVAAGLTVDLAIVLVGTSMFLLVILAEPYLRSGVQRREVRRRFLRLAAPLVVASLVAFAIPTVLVLLSRGGRI